MTSPAPIPTERLEEIIAAYRPAECDADSCEDPFCPYPHFASCGDFSLREYGLACELLSLRQQAQPTREEGWRVKELVWGPMSGLGFYSAETPFGEYRIMTRRPMMPVLWSLGREYDHETETVEQAKSACQADYASRISSALLPIDAPSPTREEGWIEAVATELARADLATMLPDVDVLSQVDVGPVVSAYTNKLRDAVAAAGLAAAEPAAHSLQTLAPASDAVKPGDET